MDDATRLAVAVAAQAAWTAAFAARDVAALADLYAPRVQFWGSTATLYLSREGVAAYFVALPPGYRRSIFAPPDVLAIGPDAFSASGTVIFVREDAEGEVELAFRMTQVFARAGGRWTIVVHHASAVPQSS